MSKGPVIVEKAKERMIKVQKMIDFILIPRSGMAQYPKMKFDYYWQSIINAISSIKQNKSVSVQQHTQLLQSPGCQSRIPQLQQNNSVNLALTSTPVASSPVSAQQGLLSSVHSSSHLELEKIPAPSSLQHASSPEGQNTAEAKQTNFSHNTSVNACDFVINSSKHNSTIKPFQRQNQELKCQKMKSQNLKQQIHPQYQQVPNPSIRPVSTSGMLQQHPLISRTELSKDEVTKTHEVHSTFATSQMPQHSSAQIEQKNLLSPPSRTVMSLDSGSSQLVTASPSTPFTPPFSVRAECASPLATPENLEKPQNTAALTLVDTQTKGLNQSLAIASPGVSASLSCKELTSPHGNQESAAMIEPIASPGISASLSCKELTSPDGNQESAAMIEPIERLMKAVESISRKALSAAVGEIGFVIRCSDSISVGENLASETSCRIQAMNSSLQYGCSSGKRLRRDISSTAPTSLTETTDSLKQSIDHIYDLDSTSTFRSKRRNIEPCHVLLDEIRYINQTLLETAIDSNSAEDTAALNAGEGTIVRCAYRAVAINDNFKMRSTPLPLPIAVWMLIPANYPNSSPRILDELTVDRSCGNNVSVHVLEKTRSRFSTLLRKLSEPVSLAEMATTWDISAREVFLEYAKQARVEIFSSRYGTWEDCVTSS